MLNQITDLLRQSPDVTVLHQQPVAAVCDNVSRSARARERNGGHPARHSLDDDHSEPLIARGQDKDRTLTILIHDILHRVFEQATRSHPFLIHLPLELLAHTVPVDRQRPVRMFPADDAPGTHEAVESFLRHIPSYGNHLFLRAVRLLVGEERKRVVNHLHVVQFRPFGCVLVAQHDEIAHFPQLADQLPHPILLHHPLHESGEAVVGELAVVGLVEMDFSQLDTAVLHIADEVDLTPQQRHRDIRTDFAKALVQPLLVKPLFLRISRNTFQQ